jgi:hypothetical protein
MYPRSSSNAVGRSELEFAGKERKMERSAKAVQFYEKAGLPFSASRWVENTSEPRTKRMKNGRDGDLAQKEFMKEFADSVEGRRGA